MTQYYGPAVDAEMAYRRERITAALVGRGTPRRRGWRLRRRGSAAR